MAGLPAAEELKPAPAVTAPAEAPPERRRSFFGNLRGWFRSLAN